MAAETSVHALEETAVSRDAQPAHAPERRVLGLADTAASGAGSIVGADTLRSGSTPTGAPEVPPRIGRFLVIRTLGAGGMGLVVEAYDPELDRKVAIKLLRAGKGHADSQTRLLREAQAMARLSHPNVVQIYDVGTLGDQVFLAMELVRGRTLGAWIEAERRGWREVVAVFLDAARGLAAAHKVGLVHRDFKPDNVLIADDGRVRVADFGLAREDRAAALVPANPGERGLLADTLTVTGVLMGTPMYMSPEQHRGEAAGPPSDVFSFFVALHEGLHGQRPFAGDTLPELAKNVFAGALVPVPAGHGVPGFVGAAIRRGLSLRPGDRFASFDEVIVALDRDPAATRRRWLLGGGAAASMVGALAFAAAQRPAERCTGGADKIAEVWGDDAAAKVRQGLAGVDAAARAAIEPRVIDGLGAYAGEWSERHRATCMAHQGGETSAALVDAQMRCLEVRRQALAGAIEAIGGGDAPLLREATMVVARLPALAACEDRAALLAEVPPPADAKVAEEVEGLRQRLARAEVIAHGGRLDEAIRIADEVRARGEALGYRPLLAEALLTKGRMALDANRMDQAPEALAKARVVATAGRVDAIAAESEARRLYVDGVFFGHLDEALAAAPVAEALIDRLDGRDDLRALLVNNLGVVRVLLGEPGEAKALFARAVTLAAEDPRIDPIDYARGYLANLAAISDDLAERDRLFADAAERLDALLGPAHPVTLQLQRSWAAHTVDPVAAADRYAPTCVALVEGRTQTYRECVECQRERAQAEEERGRLDVAREAYAAVDRCLDLTLPADDEAPMAAERASMTASARLLAGDLDGARGAAEEAATIWRPYADAWWLAPSLAEVDLVRGLSLARSGRAGEAIRPLEAAVTALEGHLARDRRAVPRRRLARARVALADALWAAQEAGALPPESTAEAARSRALALVDGARVYYRELGPGGATSLAALAAWDARR